MRLYPGLSCLTLGVSNVDRATLFYERLGWRRARIASTRAESFFELNNLLLRLTPSDALAQDVGAAEPHVHAVHSQHYGDRNAISLVMEQAGQAGARLLGAQARLSGASGAFADPDGHVWEMVFDPARIPGPDGSVRLVE
ncbi:MAG: putative Glyoxalase/bleomycin resistance protein/dioxygenase [Hyphomicrobiales bacterium]|nr:putative Glyoxalase/bleomycin resistance protein/dioxygenase [Hyphomicrobiales bacterium]